MVVNIQTISRLVERNKPMRNVVEWFIKFTLQILSAQRLIDDRKIQAASLDWERGTLSLGNDFSEQLVAKTISKYYLDRKLDELRSDRQMKQRSDYEAAQRMDLKGKLKK